MMAEKKKNILFMLGTDINYYIDNNLPIII